MCNRRMIRLYQGDEFCLLIIRTRVTSASLLQYWYWTIQRKKAQGNKQCGPQRQTAAPPRPSAASVFDVPKGNAAFDTGPDPRRSTSREALRPGRMGRRNGSGAEAPRTPDAREASRHAAPVTSASTGGRIASSGRAARRAGSAAAAALAALSPRSRLRQDNFTDASEPPETAASVLDRGGSDRSIPPVTHITQTAPPSNEELMANGDVGRAAADVTKSGVPGIGSSRWRAEDATQAEPLHPQPRPAAAPQGVQPQPGVSGPVAEAAATRALNSGLARQQRHVYGGRSVPQVGPAAVGGSTSSSSAESGSAMSDIVAPLSATPPPPPPPSAAETAASAPPAEQDGQRTGEIDLALSVVSVDSVKTDGGSHDGQTVSLSTWRNGVALSAHAGGGGESAFADSSAALNDSSEAESALGGISGLREGRRWRSAVRRLQRGNTRMLRLLRARGDEDR